MMEEIQAATENLITELQTTESFGSSKFAKNTVLLLRRMIWKYRWSNPRDLMNTLKSEGQRLMSAQPAETSVSNMVKRVLKVVREEYSSFYKRNNPEAKEIPPLVDRWTDDFSPHYIDFKDSVVDSVNELLSELDTSTESIARQALEHIHSNEVILTAGKSSTVEAFLKKAAKNRKFQVIVAESAPSLMGHTTAVRLAEAGIETTVITDSAAFAVMSRVNKVIVGAHTVLANGGLKADNGLHSIALAAKHHHVPLIVCAALSRLSPQFYTASDQPGFNRMLSPEAVLPSGETALSGVAHTLNPALDYVPPELVGLFISNIGGVAPFYVYRQLSELYHPDDHQL